MKSEKDNETGDEKSSVSMSSAHSEHEGGTHHSRTIEEQYMYFALELSGALIQCGAETYRAEDCCANILGAFGATDIQVLTLPTALVLSSRFENGAYTLTRTVKTRDIDLSKVDIINSISRRLSSGKITFEQAKEELKALNGNKRPFVSTAIFGCFAAAFFALLFGGNIIDFAFACICSFASFLVMASLRRVINYTFIVYFGGSIIIALLAKCAVWLVPQCGIAVIIIGGITPMVPGLGMTNSIRDTIHGDLVSGTARGVEALLDAISITAGVCSVLIAI